MEPSLDLSLDSFTKQSKLDDYVNRLENEMRKIDAFKRELPLCVLLLQHAILRLKEEQSSKDKPLIGEFISLKRSSHGESEKGMNEKSSAQMWNSNLNFDDEISNQKSNMNLNECGCATKEDVGFSEVPKLTLMTQISDPFSAAEMKGQAKLRRQQQAIRKQRRCWSPELHRRFVDALQRLGGSQVATPKQIRELMQVEGLTNEQVKSHLQKYRLHIRKLSPTEEHSGYHDTKASVRHAESPDGPLHGGGCGKALSITEGEEDAKSEGHSWKGRIQKHRD